jgi:hypothetical protein
LIFYENNIDKPFASPPTVLRIQSSLRLPINLCKRCSAFAGTSFVEPRLRAGYYWGNKHGNIIAGAEMLAGALKEFILLLDSGSTDELQIKKGLLKEIFSCISFKEQEEVENLLTLVSKITPVDHLASRPRSAKLSRETGASDEMLHLPRKTGDADSVGLQKSA